MIQTDAERRSFTLTLDTDLTAQVAAYRAAVNHASMSEACRDLIRQAVSDDVAKAAAVQARRDAFSAMRRSLFDRVRRAMREIEVEIEAETKAIIGG